MSSASLAVVRRAHPDMVRVAALSAAITLNLAALIYALRPLAPQIAQVLESPQPTTVRIIEPPPPPPMPPDIVVKPLPKPMPVTAPVHVIHEEPVTPPTAATPPVTEPSHNALPATPPPAVVATPDIAPGVVSLAYRSSPLRFPSQAIRQHMQGTVTLRVLVDETGKPVDVVIEQSSGYLLLDKSAREQVLATWRFQPAQINGHAVKAWARVPVNFLLQDT